jgi:hypothetical protein
MPVKDISNGLEDLGFNVINVRQMSATWTALTEHTSVAPLHLFLVTLSINVKSQVIFKLNSLNHIIISVELYKKALTGLTQCYNCQKFGHAWTNCKQPPWCLWSRGDHLYNALKHKCRIYAEMLQLHPGRTETSSSITPGLQPHKWRTAKEKSTTSSQQILWEDVLQ